MRLGKIQKTVFITQEDKRFKGTNYENENFTLMITNEPIRKSVKSQLGRDIAQKEWEEIGGTGNIPDIILSKWIFLSLIDDWQGFEDEDGEYLEATIENKSNFYDFDSGLFSLASMAYMDATKADWDKPKEEKEKNEEDVIDEAYEVGLDSSAGNIQQTEDEVVARFVSPAVTQ